MLLAAFYTDVCRLSKAASILGRERACHPAKTNNTMPITNAATGRAGVLVD